MSPLVVWVCLFVTFVSASSPPPCDDTIYCIGGEGTLLHVVQMATIYNDSKTFVDKPLSKPRTEVEANFAKLMSDTDQNPSKEDVQKFVDDNFLEEGAEFEDWDPSDWKEDPAILQKIKDENLRDLADDLNHRWLDLGRKIRSDVKTNPERNSLIYMPNPFIVPGGRFREMYYWDSYWTIQGLLLSEMTETVKGMLENFAYLIESVNLIPNGNRIYYTRRSQPPLFIPMVDIYYQATQDKSFIQNNIDSMEKEFKFWESNRTISVKGHNMFHYDVEVDLPRPESYREDYRDAQHFPVSEQPEFYMNMKSGAESGWDYSTRWFITSNGDDRGNITDTKTRHIVQVDLNSYLCRNARVLSEFFDMLGQSEKAQMYKEKMEKIKSAIQEVLWNEEQGVWFDYDLINSKQREYFYPSNIAPLWAECYSETKTLGIAKKVVQYLKSSGGVDYEGGVPTSLVKSNQQWDFSNGWPPLQEIMVTGLLNTGDETAKDLAADLAKRWVQNVYLAYDQSQQKMFEKYDIIELGLPGGHGEYEVQEGFGWSNGVVMHFFDLYGEQLTSGTPSVAKGNSWAMLPVWIWAITRELLQN